MIAKSFKFTFFFFIAFIAIQWLFRSEVVWLDIIGISFVVFLLYLLFEFVDKRDERRNKE